MLVTPGCLAGNLRDGRAASLQARSGGQQALRIGLDAEPVHALGETGHARLALELRAALGPLAADHEPVRAGQPRHRGEQRADPLSLVIGAQERDQRHRVTDA